MFTKYLTLVGTLVAVLMLVMGARMLEGSFASRASLMAMEDEDVSNVTQFARTQLWPQQKAHVMEGEGQEDLVVEVPRNSVTEMKGVSEEKETKEKVDVKGGSEEKEMKELMPKVKGVSEEKETKEEKETVIPKVSEEKETKEEKQTKELEPKKNEESAVLKAEQVIPSVKLYKINDKEAPEEKIRKAKQNKKIAKKQKKVAKQVIKMAKKEIKKAEKEIGVTKKSLKKAGKKEAGKTTSEKVAGKKEDKKTAKQAVKETNMKVAEKKAERQAVEKTALKAKKEGKSMVIPVKGGEKKGMTKELAEKLARKLNNMDKKKANRNIMVVCDDKE
ncbi:hypothetical protein Pcinc_029292 [Petrolisthes cinctipes]|uniref:Uncharacterized protein n=1 Tax=Petrolisthes cinctipes TaxID=88211 RepID=A0AAE1K5X3_PETCI|nr:hypothetical protein Pcinc_029292 [Petrolisthes cinctipes]